MVVEWKKRCDNDHLGHYVMDYMRKGGNEICQIDAATGEEETYASVLSRSIRLAQCFQKLGLVPGDVIAMGGKNHLDGHIPFYAGTMSGQPVAGIDSSLKYNEVKHLFNIVRPKIAFCEYDMFEDYKNVVRDLRLDTEIVTFGGGENSFSKFMEANKSLKSEQEFQVATFNTDEVYWILVSTSGTTGLPKVVALTHPHIKYVVDFFRFPKPKDGVRRTALNVSHFHWYSGCLNGLLMPITHIKVQTSAPVTTEHAIDIINKYKPAGILCTPTLLSYIMNHKTPCDLTCFDKIIVAGSKTHKEFLWSLRARVRPDTEITQSYGMTELGSMTISFIDDLNGKLNPKYEAKIVSPETGKEILEPNVRGELYVRGPALACYYNDPVETKKLFTDDGFVKTGDMFYKDEHGDYIFVDRLKMILKYKGYHIVPPEVEEVILRHPGVADVCVTGVPHAQDDEHVVACVVRKPGAHVTAQEIKDLVAEHLSPSKHLHGGVVFLDALPITTTGKVARFEVKKLVLTAHRE